MNGVGRRGTSSGGRLWLFRLIFFGCGCSYLIGQLAHHPSFQTTDLDSGWPVVGNWMHQIVSPLSKSPSSPTWSTISRPQNGTAAATQDPPEKLVLDQATDESTVEADKLREQAQPSPPLPLLREQPPQHVVFIGDSLLRYAFLEWLDHWHNHRLDGGHDDEADGPTNNRNHLAPPKLIHEKLHESWHEYFLWSTQHFGGQMVCDCQRGEEFRLGREVENRYYRSTDGSFAATYLQGYGDNQAHGRFLPPDQIWNATVTRDERDGVNTTGMQAHGLNFQWAYYGFDWDRLLEEYVSKLVPTPTAVVMNLGLWPHHRTTFNIRRILEAAYRATNETGVVIWRGITPRRDKKMSDPSEADLAVKKWSFHLPWLQYQPFPHLNRTNDDYFDVNHFSNPLMYRQWNKQMELALQPQTKRHRVFILVGGARTLESTIDSYFNNIVSPLCPPRDCVAHLVTHLSSSDNRPSDIDTRGKAVAAQDANIQHFLENAPANIILHVVQRYDIASPEEAEAMDLFEEETTNSTIKQRMRMFRKADPRRYSMWFARAWSWRHVEHLAKDHDFDFVAFTRPDMLWLMPMNSVAFFFDNQSEGYNDVWVHDTYYNNVPDTFAFFTSMETAGKYFSISVLVRPGIACLGGPTFNETTVESWLSEAGIETVSTDWCKNIPSPTPDQGWSERILRRKIELTGMKTRHFSAAAVLLRWYHRIADNLTGLSPECFATNCYTHIGHAPTHVNASGVPFVGCQALASDLRSNFPITNLANFTLSTYRPFQLRLRTGEHDDCLALVNSTLYQMPCDYLAADQVFTSTRHNSIVGLAFDCFLKALCPGNDDGLVVPSNAGNFTLGTQHGWEKVPIPLNDMYPFDHWEKS